MSGKRALIKMIGGGLVGATISAVYYLLVRPWHLRWGATHEEVGDFISSPGKTTLPGLSSGGPQVGNPAKSTRCFTAFF